MEMVKKLFAVALVGLLSFSAAQAVFALRPDQQQGGQALKYGVLVTNNTAKSDRFGAKKIRFNVGNHVAGGTSVKMLDAGQNFPVIKAPITRDAQGNQQLFLWVSDAAAGQHNISNPTLRSFDLTNAFANALAHGKRLFADITDVDTIQVMDKHPDDASRAVVGEPIPSVESAALAVAVK